MVVSRRGASVRAPRTKFESDSSVRIVVGDCVAEMSKLPAGSVDLVFADPPYNLQLKGDLKRPDESHVDAVNDDWDKFSSFAAYDDFTRAWLLACRRVMKPSATPGDLVIDPFTGTGTTGAVAKRLGRRYIGFERDKTYATAAEARIAAVEPLPEATLAPFMTARDAPRVAFSELIERGMIPPGTRLVDSRKRHGALVRADGAIMLGDKVGSIHRIGAVAQGSGACNGWTFWHIETKKGLRLIDELRAEIRSEMAAV